MNPTSFDHLVIVLGRRIPRRSLVGLLGALGLTGLVASDVAAACLKNGQRCGGARGTCCSGLCKHKRGTHKKFCRQAANQGECTVEENECNGGSLSCGTNNDGGNCVCYETTTGRSFCGAQSGVANPVHCDCTSDTQCVQRIGKGA